MRNIAKIFSLIIAIMAGIWGVLSARLAYKYYKIYQETGGYVDYSNAISFEQEDITSLTQSAIFFLLMSIIATFTFRYLHKNKTQNEDNPTILDYNNATSNPNNEQANQ